jgi:dTDP-glucose pyrophosphorylase
MNILIPLAGKGSRFRQKFDKPKPLIEINSKPIIQHVIESIKIPGTYIFIIQKEHNINNRLSELLNKLCEECKIIEIDYYTDGAAQSCYLAKEYIDNDKPLFMTNCDQIYEWDPTEFINYCKDNNYDGVVVTEKKQSPTYSYIKLDKNNYGLELAEKEIISNNALIGMHYWKKGSDFILSAKELIEKNIKMKNEYYISLTYNILINKKLKISNYELKSNEKYYVVGTPKELFDYLNLKQIKLYETDLIITGHLTKDLIYDIYNNFKKKYLLGGIMNFWDQFLNINKKNYTVDLSPLKYGESIILIDKLNCERYNRSQLNIKDIDYKFKNSKWFHMMYINELKEYNLDFLNKIKSIVLSCDICGGVDLKVFDINLLSFFDFIFLSIDDLHKDLTIDNIKKYIKGFIILHGNNYCKIIGGKNTNIEIYIKINKNNLLDNINVLGAGDYFAASFVYYMMDKDINDIEELKKAVTFTNNQVSIKLINN